MVVLIWSLSSGGRAFISRTPFSEQRHLAETRILWTCLISLAEPHAELSSRFTTHDDIAERLATHHWCFFEPAIATTHNSQIHRLRPFRRPYASTTDKIFTGYATRNVLIGLTMRLALSWPHIRKEAAAKTISIHDHDQVRNACQRLCCRKEMGRGL